MIYLMVYNSTTYEAFTNEQDAIDRKNKLNKTLSFIHKLMGFRWGVQKILLQ